MDLPERVSPPFSLADFPDIIDVRSPSEFEEDHVPGAVNLPVLTDEERHQVGALNADNPYEARKVGATIITRNIHRHLSTTLADHPNSFAPLIYCWRGNLRSNSMAVIFRAIGWRARVIEGGYKAWRRYLMADLEPTIANSCSNLIVLGGLTGCGKTRLLHELKDQGAQILDLEGLARHRGSILGTDPRHPQPNQKRFESLLWEAFREFDPARPIFTEAESNRIGRLQCPPPLWKRLGEGKIILVEMPLSERGKLLAQEYEHFIGQPDSLKEILNGLRRLRGNEQVDHWHQQIDSRNWTGFLESILVDHYDLCYRRPGSTDSVYPEPRETITIPSSEAADFQSIASRLIETFS